jgi:hypothetical protein
MLADTIYTYTYTGNPLSTPLPSSGYLAPFNASDIVTASFTTSSPLGPNMAFAAVAFDSLTISTGPFTLTSTSSVSPRVCAATNSSGNITTWDAAANFDPIDGIITFNAISGEKCEGLLFGSTLAQDSVVVDYPPGTGATNSDDPGTWTLSVSTTAIPEPCTAELLGVGLLSIAGIVRRKLAHS